MDRDEVLVAVKWAADMFDELSVDCTDDAGRTRWQRRSELLRAAAEIIRQSGWRPIAEAPEDAGYFGKRTGCVWVRCQLPTRQRAVDLGYTHYLPEPEPPAREGSKTI